MLHSGVKLNRKIPQILLDKCKCEIKKPKVENLVNGDLEPSPSDDETENDFDNESDNESDNE